GLGRRPKSVGRPAPAGAGGAPPREPIGIGLEPSLVIEEDECADQAIALAPDLVWIQTNRAHALMFLGRAAEARTLYLRYRDEERVLGDKSWKTATLEDFAELRQAGLTHRLMDEIAKLFAGRG